ncbi:MAG: hypothetical protein IKH42_00450 [Lachnospiraceae bacterium]|nr:hypothetical protein [Lachnospiraceae bacterium]MBR4542294.1 hypothetical protein [Lachnospiraceae bacterium]
MIVFNDLPTMARTFLLCLEFLILWLTMMLLAESVYQRMYRGFSVFFFLIVIVNYIFFQLCLDEKYRMDLWVVIAYIAAMILFDIFIIRKGIKYRQENFTVISVKQGLDAMEEGICFYTENGLPQFTNKYMNDVSLAISGRTIVDASGFWNDLQRGYIDKKCRIITSIDDMVIVKTPEKVCAISNRDIGGELKEMVMVDITSEYGTFEELLGKYESLEQQQERLKEYNKNVTQATIERELLNAKIHIHDELGEILLAAKRFIQNKDREEKAAKEIRNIKTAEAETNGAPGRGDIDRRTVTELWLKNLSLLGVEREQTEEDEYAEIYRAASDIGMKIEVTGELPQEGKAKSVTASAMHECLTNTFRHAGGDTVYVESVKVIENTKTGKNSSGYILTFTNNGKPPEGDIEERGGLKSLRKMAEDAGFDMKIETAGGFKLILDLSS